MSDHNWLGILAMSLMTWTMKSQDKRKMPIIPNTTARNNVNVNKIISPMIVCNFCNLVMFISYDDI